MNSKLKQWLPLLLGLMFAVKAYAIPTVNDYANYNVHLTRGGQSVDVKLEKTLVEVNTALNAFKIREQQTHNGSTQTSESWQSADKVPSKKDLENLLTNCAQNGGSREAVQVQGQSVETCAISWDNENGKGGVWLGVVPFGLVKFTTSDKAKGVDMDATLVEFRLGQVQ